jgi:RNA recognition motif-containing protein
MSRGNYTQGKRQRDAGKAEKKRDKEERRRRRRERGPGEVELVTAEAMTGELPSIEEAMQHISVTGAGAGDRAAPAIPCRLFVGGLSWDTTAASLRVAFEAQGPVADAVVVHDRDTGRSRGFGFVTMANRKDAPGAIKAMHNAELDGRSIMVNVATERGR